MSSRLLPHAATAGGLVKTPPSRSQSSSDGRHADPSHAFVIHRAVHAEPEDVEPVRAPRHDSRRTREDPAEALPVERRWPPRRAVPRLVIHRAVGAEPEDVEPVLTPRRDRRRTREDAAEPLPVQRRRPPRRAVPRLVIHRAVGAEPEDVEPVLPPRRDPIRYSVEPSPRACSARPGASAMPRSLRQSVDRSCCRSPVDCSRRWCECRRAVRRSRARCPIRNCRPECRCRCR
jgi:hypothetical protein